MTVLTWRRAALLLALVAIVLPCVATFAQSGVRITSIRSGQVVQGGSNMRLEFGNGPAARIEFTADGKEWTPLNRSGTSPVEIMIPRVDSSRCQIRLTYESGAVALSDPFTVDSTAPVSKAMGNASVRAGIVHVPFHVFGYDVDGVWLEYRGADGRVQATAVMPPEQAKREGFKPPMGDGLYDVTLLSSDRIGNKETKAAPDTPQLLIDATKPVATLDLGLAKPYAFGGKTLNITYNITEDNLADHRFEYVVGKANIDRNARGLQIPVKPNGSKGVVEWELPRENHAQVAVVLIAVDSSGNETRTVSNTFSLFSDTPQAIITGESPVGESRVAFTLDYLFAEALRQVVPQYNVWIYEGTWNNSTQRFVWDKQNAIRDGDFGSSPDKTKIEVATKSTVNRAFCARIYAGPDFEDISELEPTDTTAPESVFIPSAAGASGFGSLARVRLDELPREKRMVREGATVELAFSLPTDISAYAEVEFQYSQDGGKTWPGKIGEPISVTDRQYVKAREFRGVFPWTPAGNVGYALVRAVTRLEVASVPYEVQDLMNEGVIVDSTAPSGVEFLRVKDHMGRELKSGDYTNSRELKVEWTATDEGGAGLSHGILWDDTDKTFADAEPAQVWNNHGFVDGTTTHSADMRRLDPLAQPYPLNLGRDMAPKGKLGLFLEAFDHAGNSSLRGQIPPNNQPPMFMLNVDFIAPKVRITKRPDMSDVRPGDVVAIAWEARDDQPNPRIETSMDPTPVTIYFVDGSGRRTIAGPEFTSLAPTGEMAITIPPVAGDSFTILVSAIDRAGNESDAADMQAHVRLGISRPKVPGVMLSSRTGDPKGKAHSFTWESGNDMPMENIDKLMLWVSMDKGMSWQMASEFLPNAPITYTAEKDGHYAWALTASSVFGLAEPPPSSSASIEQQVMLDWTPPMVELEVVGEQKDVYVVGDQPPMVRYRITDETFDPNKVRVEISTGEGGIPFDASRTVNGEWMAIPLTLSEGSISIRVTAIDDLGNQGEAQPLTLNVLGKGNWYFTSPAQSATWLTGTQLRLQWERAGAVAENGKVDLYYEEVRQSETGEWAAVGEPVVVKMGCPDIAQFGMYKQDKGVPSREMFVRYLLKTKDVRGMPQEARSAVVEIVKPTPVPSVRTDEEYIDGLKEHPATVVVRNASGGAYELPPKIVRLYYKYYAPGSDTPARDIWEWQAYEVKSGLEPGEVSRTLGTYDVAFVPTAGEGRYEIVPYFEDDLGNTSAPITMETQPEATLVFDAAPPVMTLEADIGPRPFYLANEIKQLYFTAMDATLKKDSLQFEIAKVSTNDWAIVDWVPMLDESRETATMIAGSVTPMFPDAERYLIRVSALDALGRRGYASLGGEFLADQGDYVAVQPVEAEDATERYTSKHYSRRGSFRIQVEARRPWGSGLKSLTLWWRKRSPTGESTPWNSTMFNEWRTVSGWQSLPFTAKESGDYEFIVGSESVRGQLEMDGAPEMDAEPELYVSVTVDDYLLTVEPLKPAPMPMTGPDRRAEQLAFNRLIPGAVYLLEWRIHSGIYTTETSFMMASGFAGKYEPAILIERSATAEPEINRYVAETMPRRKEGGRYTQERLMRCYWRCPESLANTNRADFHIKIIARESSDAMPEFRREAFSPRYMIGATPSADVERNLLYYRAKMEDGRRAMKKGEHATALRHFGDAKHEIDTAEVNLALAEAYEKLGEALKAKHHRTHATTVSAPDTAQ